MRVRDENIILMTDSYKFTHWCQYPASVRYVESYFESRGGRWHDVVFFGLQYLLHRYLAGQVVTMEKIDEAEDLIRWHMGSRQHFNRKGWEYIAQEKQGRLPISIRAVPEGTVVPAHNVLMVVRNTDPNCFWLTNYLETLLVQTWYPCTVATQSREMKALIRKYLARTGTPEDIDFKLHDFGYRGVSSHETAGLGGAAHLVNFQGTDTFAAVQLLRDYYGAKMPGYSVPAAEHSTITSWGKDEEEAALSNMLEQYPTGTVAVVSDSYDIFHACEELWGERLRDKVLNRDGVLVIRPDSGDPPDVLAGADRNVLTILGEKFGYTTNAKGYKVLNPKVRVIQGDGIDIAMIDRIYYTMQERGWSADNVGFGSGGGLLQKLDRDTLKFAFKCSSVTVDVNGKLIDRHVFKSPITDRGKISKFGRLKLVREMGAHGSAYVTRQLNEPGEDELVEVFRDGLLRRQYTVDWIRERAALR